MNVQRSAFRHDVLIAVAVLFTLIVFLYLSHICRGFQVLISGYGTVYSIISCHRIFVLSLGFADSGELRRGTFSKCNNPLLHFHPYWLQSAVGSPEGECGHCVTSADQGENVCAFSHGQTVCMKLFCVNFLLQSVSTDTFSKACGHRNSPNERMCAVSITSVLRSFAAYIHTSNGIYSTCRHSSGMSSGTYVHGETS